MIAVSLVMYGSVERDSGVARRNQRTSVASEASSIPSESQKGHAPDPGPRPSIHPMLSSALLTIRPMDASAVRTPISSSAVRTVMMFPSSVDSIRADRGETDRFRVTARGRAARPRLCRLSEERASQPIPGAYSPVIAPAPTLSIRSRWR